MRIKAPTNFLKTIVLHSSYTTCLWKPWRQTGWFLRQQHHRSFGRNNFNRISHFMKTKFLIEVVPILKLCWFTFCYFGPHLVVLRATLGFVSRGHSWQGSGTVRGTGDQILGQFYAWKHLTCYSIWHGRFLCCPPPPHTHRLHPLILELTEQMKSGTNTAKILPKIWLLWVSVVLELPKIKPELLNEELNADRRCIWQPRDGGKFTSVCSTSKLKIWWV